MNQPVFESEKAYRSHLESLWIDDVEALMMERGTAYFELLVESLARLLDADRVFVASFDLELQYGTTIADFNDGEHCDNYDFFLPDTAMAEMAQARSIVVSRIKSLSCFRVMIVCSATLQCWDVLHWMKAVTR